MQGDFSSLFHWLQGKRDSYRLVPPLEMTWAVGGCSVMQPLFPLTGI